MKKLTTVILSAAIVPLFALGSAAIAQDRDSTQRNADRQSGEQFMTRTPAGALYADDVIGADVKNRASGDDIGDVKDLVIGKDGRIVGVVVSTGTTLGLGGRKVSLNWNQLQHAKEDGDLVFYVELSEEALKNAPEHKRN
ncbi:PRC-barrel domain-containing protein [Isoalcanivorax indicus]|uniref:PRC-barrel domain-containing protein n=1 Tax=Isoalcanivorax indicus TaxID=2202653 RepID=UPI000DB9CF99|nr:PRC-barrel domain-containing protein [Isoalcanivorax indicus]